jgi:hypothetical protein
MDSRCVYFVYLKDIQQCNLGSSAASDQIFLNAVSVIGPKYCTGETFPKNF